MKQDGDYISSLCLDAIAKNDCNNLYTINNFLLDYKDGKYILYRNEHDRDKGINTMSRDHVFRLKQTCNYFKLNLFDEYFKSLKRGKRISDKEKSKLNFDLWLYLNDYQLFWQFFVWIWYAGVWYYFNRVLIKVFDLKMYNWLGFKTVRIKPRHVTGKEFKNKVVEYICENQVIMPGFVHNQILWGIRCCKKRYFKFGNLLKSTWKGNPEAELLLLGKTDVNNINFIKLAKWEITQRVPAIYDDRYYEEGDEVSLRYYVCLRLAEDFLPIKMYNELKEYSK